MNILLTSVGRRTYLINYFKSALKNEGLIHAANSSLTYSVTQADKYTLTPEIYSNEYISFLLEYCLSNKISAIIPLFDIDLPILSKHKQQFLDADITLVVSDSSVINICNDKWISYLFFKENSLLTPKTHLTLEGVKQSLDNTTISFPLILKPRWGMGSIGLYIAENLDELNIFYQKLHREIFKTYLKFESDQNIDECILIQEYINGVELGLEVINDLNGNYITTLSKEKLAMRAGETDSAITIENEDVSSLGEKLSLSLKHIANLDVDVFISDDKYYVLEMNARFGGQYPFSHLAGVDLPKQIVKWLKGDETDMRLLIAKINSLGYKDIVPVLCN